jgi:hypothetical protein
MVLAWEGKTPFGNGLMAYICPKCYSTRFICAKKDDPMFKLLCEIYSAFEKIWAKGEQAK